MPFFDLIFISAANGDKVGNLSKVSGPGKKVARKPALDYLYVVLISREISIQAKQQSKHTRFRCRGRRGTTILYSPDFVHLRFPSCNRSSEPARIVLGLRGREKNHLKHDIELSSNFF